MRRIWTVPTSRDRSERKWTAHSSHLQLKMQDSLSTWDPWCPSSSWCAATQLGVRPCWAKLRWLSVLSTNDQVRTSRSAAGAFVATSCSDASDMHAQNPCLSGNLHNFLRNFHEFMKKLIFHWFSYLLRFLLQSNELVTSWNCAAIASHCLSIYLIRVSA